MWKAFYASESEIPEDIKKFYVQRNGRWEFDGTKFEGLDGLLNPALNSKKEEILGEKKQMQQRAETAEAESTRLRTELSTLKSPGNVVLNKEEADMFTEYKSIGTPKDLKKMKTTNAELTEKVQLIEQEQTLQNLTKETGLNFEVVRDLMKSDYGKDVKIIAKEVEVTDAKGNKTSRKVPSIEIETTVNGKTQITEKKFEDFVKGLPQYMADNIYAKTDAKPNQQQQQSQDSQRRTLRLPSNSGSSAATNNENGGSENKSRAQKFNEQRSTRPSPFSPGQAAK